MHLPYCYQARRTFIEIYAQEQFGLNSSDVDYKDQIKTISKSDDYLLFVNKTIYPSEIASAQVGNLYTGSLFLALLSTLSYHLDKKHAIVGKKIGFIAYGSGSKSKVFEAEVQPDWQNAISTCYLFETLDNSIEIDFDTYLRLHKKEQKTAVCAPRNEFSLDYIENKNPLLLGARYYSFK